MKTIKITKGEDAGTFEAIVNGNVYSFYANRGATDKWSKWVLLTNSERLWATSKNNCIEIIAQRENVA